MSGHTLGPGKVVEEIQPLRLLRKKDEIGLFHFFCHEPVAGIGRELNFNSVIRFPLTVPIGRRWSCGNLEHFLGMVML